MKTHMLMREFHYIEPRLMLTLVVVFGLYAVAALVQGQRSKSKEEHHHHLNAVQIALLWMLVAWSRLDILQLQATLKALHK